MQQRKFLCIASQSIVASILPGVVSEASDHIARFDPVAKDLKPSVRAPQWQPPDCSLPSKGMPENPFAVMLPADVTSPSGAIHHAGLL